MRKIALLRVGVLAGCCLAGFCLAGCETPVPAPPGPVPPAPPAAPSAEAAPETLPEGETAGPIRDATAGAYMDRLERDLRGLLYAYGIRVARRADTLLVVLPRDPLFEGDGLSAAGQGEIHALVRALRYYNHTVGQVNGYTDTSGSFQDNLAISEAQAERVRVALIAGGISGRRFSAHGFGETELKVETGDHVAEPRNRRIEIVILPQT